MPHCIEMVSRNYICIGISVYLIFDTDEMEGSKSVVFDTGALHLQHAHPPLDTLSPTEGASTVFAGTLII
jgi:hypothetical protein